jgi:hypothetical protein
MSPSRFTLGQLMIATAVVGVLSGLLVRYPEPLISVIVVVGAIFTVGFSISLGFKWIPRIPLRIRLPIELTILVYLLNLSVVAWTPGFYQSEQRRCEELARRASRVAVDGPEKWAALDREADWFARKASELRWRGLWLGLNLGPFSRDEVILGGRDEVYQLGVAESIERHEKRLERWTTPGSPPP